MPDALALRRLTAALVLLAAAASAQPVPLDSLARSYADTNSLPSLVVAVSVDGERHIVGAGDVEGSAPDAHTRYEIGSVSKVLTSLALADAVAGGEVELTTPVADLLSDTLALASFASGPYRLVDLATHTSGLPRLPADLFVTPGFDMADPYTLYGADRLMAFLEQFEIETAPGETYEYSNLGAGLLGYALSRHDGQTYAETVRQRVLAPLGMRETALDAPADARFAEAHGADGAPVPHWTFTDATAGAGVWRSTPADLLTLVEALLAPQTTPLADALALATAPHAEAPDLGGQIGLGWFLASTPNGPFVWHNGMTGGSASFVGALPEAGLGVVVLTNRQSSVDALGIDVLRRLLAAEE